MSAQQTCPSGKRPYPSRADARAAVRALRARRGNARRKVEVGVYCCPACAKWHLTSQL